MQATNPFGNDPTKAGIFDEGYVVGFMDPDESGFRALESNLLEVSNKVFRWAQGQRRRPSRRCVTQVLEYKMRLSAFKKARLRKQSQSSSWRPRSLWTTILKAALGLEARAPMNTRIKAFFDEYEEANSDFDVVKIASFYADVFMFAGPQDAQPVKKDELVKVLPWRKEVLSSMGLVASKVVRVEASELDPSYVLARVLWKMRIARGGKDPAESENSISYVLQDSGGSFQIVFQVDHQNLVERIRALG